MLRHAGVEREAGSARARLTQALDSGAAWEKFIGVVEAQGGDPRSVERFGALGAAPRIRSAAAKQGGHVVRIDTYRLGEIAVSVGAGRRTKEQPIDPRVGLVIRVRIGDLVEAGSTLAELHLGEERPDVVAALEACFEIGPGPVEPPELVLERID